MSYRNGLDTPCLVVHERILRRNIQRMADHARAAGVGLRPHFKTHKTAGVVRLQQQAGATGIVCAKLGEAEVIAEAGATDDIFIANQIVGALKMQRLVRLLDRVNLRVAVDSVEGATELETAVATAGKLIDVVIEVNTGADRAGVLPGEETLRLAEAIRAELSHLRLIGLMTYEGHAYGVRDEDERRSIALAAVRRLVDSAQLLRERGFAIEVVSVGCTPTAAFVAEVPGVTELRVGNYVFGDNSLFQLSATADDCALRVLATVTSRPASDRVVIDAGSKALSNDKSERRTGYGYEGFGYVVDCPDARVARLSEEHGVLVLNGSVAEMRVGDKIEIIPNHACQAVNLYDELFVISDGAVADVWPIIGRGMIR